MSVIDEFQISKLSIIEQEASGERSAERSLQEEIHTAPPLASPPLNIYRPITRNEEEQGILICT